jgi:RimJ/RimL family protein N-acetyltransferase
VNNTQLTLEFLEKKYYAAAAKVFAACHDFLVEISGEKPESTAMELVNREAEDATAHSAVFAGIRLSSSRRLIGVATYQPCSYGGDPSAAWIALLMIAPPYRGHGFGTAACHKIEETVFGGGAVSIKLGVLLNNPAAMRFWKATGYSDTGLVKPYGSGRSVAILEKKRAAENINE